MRLRRYLAMAGATAALWVTGCAAGQADAASPWLEREMLTLPFAGGDDFDQLQKSYDEIIELLQKRAADEARYSDVEPQTGFYEVFRRDGGEPYYVVGAITPKKGVFFSVRGFHQSHQNERTLSQRKGKIDACRFELLWDKLPAGAFAPGMHWATFYMPILECETPSATHLAEVASWRDMISQIGHRVEGEASEGSVRVELLREMPRREVYKAGTQEYWILRGLPFDAVTASAPLMAKGDRVVRAIPVFDRYGYGLNASVVWTQRGRMFAYVDPYGTSVYSDTRCAVEGLSWNDIVTKPFRPAMAAAHTLCRGLYSEQYRARREEENRRRIADSPPVRPPAPLPVPGKSGN